MREALGLAKAGQGQPVADADDYGLPISGVMIARDHYASQFS